MAERLRGILPVLQTPFDAAGDLVEIDLRREVSFCITAGAHGLVVPALASEFMVLTDDERRRIVEIVVDEASGKLPVVAGVAAPSARAAAAFSRHARQAGAAAVMALPPYVRRPGPAGVIDYFKAVGEAAELPVILQNAPPPFALGMGVDTLLDILRQVPGVQYLKEERPPAGHYISIAAEAAGDRLLGIFGGAGGSYLLSELARGANGCMPSAAATDVLVAVFEAFTAGDCTSARDLYDRVLPLLNLEMSVLMAVSKEILRRRRVFTQVVVRDPEYPGLDGGDIAEIDAIWRRLEPVLVTLSRK
jgi:dihydrodipicolinate synthase/N-acetylneuraminate lyase